MPDYEIRYFRADGSLALVQMTVQPSESHARDHANAHQLDHARVEVRESRTAPARRR